MHRKIFENIFKIVIVGLLISSTVLSQDTDDLDKEMEDLRYRTQKIVKEFESFQAEGEKAPADSLQQKKQIDSFVDRNLMRYRTMSIPDIKAEINNSATLPQLRSLFKIFPRFLTFVAHMLNDGIAVKKLMALPNDTKKMRQVLLFMAITFILSWALGRILILPDQKAGTRIFMLLSKTAFIWMLRIVILIYYYGENLSPSFRIAKEIILKDIT